MRFIVALANLLALTGAVLLPSDWTTYGGSFDHVGYKDETIGHRVAGVNLRWSVGPMAVLSNIVAVQGRVVVAAAMSLDQPSPLNLYVLDEKSGATVKSTLLPCSSPRISPDFNDGILVSCDGEFLRYDLATLHLTWSASIIGKPVEGLPGSFFALVQSTGFAYVATFDDVYYHITAIDTLTGALKFVSQVPRHNSECRTMSLVVYGDRLFYASEIVGEIDPISGFTKSQSTFKPQCPGTSQFQFNAGVVAANDKLMFAYPLVSAKSYSIAALDVNSLDLNWISSPCQYDVTMMDLTPAVDAQRDVFFKLCKRTAGTTVDLVNATTGQTIQSYQDCVMCMEQPLLLNDHMLVKQYGGRSVYVYSLDSLNRVAMFGTTTMELAYHGKTVFASNSDNTFNAYELV